MTLIFVSCHSGPAPEGDISQNAHAMTVRLNEAQSASAAVSVQPLEKRSLSTVLKVNGTIDVPPQSLVSVSMPFGGFLRSTQLMPGMQVRKGEVIATLEDPQYIQLQEDYLTAKAALMYAGTEYQRQKDLQQTQSGTGKIFQQAEMEYERQKIAVTSLGEKLKLIHLDPEQVTPATITREVRLQAPISGYVSAIHVNIGRYVNPADVLFDLIDPAKIHLNLRVFEKDIDKLVPGQTLEAYTLHQPEVRYPSTIRYIDPVLSADRTAEVQCYIGQYDDKLKPGMYMNAEIELRQHDAYAVPEEALVHYEGLTYVFVETGIHMYELVPVQAGVREGNFVEIMNAESLLTKPVVTKGAYTLLMELKNVSDE